MPTREKRRGRLSFGLEICEWLSPVSARIDVSQSKSDLMPNTDHHLDGQTPAINERAFVGAGICGFDHVTRNVLTNDHAFPSLLLMCAIHLYPNITRF